jgi:hypothetical protein
VTVIRAHFDILADEVRTALASTFPGARGGAVLWLADGDDANRGTGTLTQTRIVTTEDAAHVVAVLELLLVELRSRQS